MAADVAKRKSENKRKNTSAQMLNVRLGLSAGRRCNSLFLLEALQYKVCVALCIFSVFQCKFQGGAAPANEPAQYRLGLHCPAFHFFFRKGVSQLRTQTEKKENETKRHVKSCSNKNKTHIQIIQGKCLDPSSCELSKHVKEKIKTWVAFLAFISEWDDRMKMLVNSSFVVVLEMNA